MSDDLHSSDAPGDAEPPDRAASGDVFTTGHSSHEVETQDAHGGPIGHGDAGNDGHGGHSDDASELSTLVSTRLSQLILPAIILVFVSTLVAVPVLNAFAPRPAASPAEEGSAPQTPATPIQSPVNTGSTAPAGTATSQPQPTAPPATPTTSANLPISATQTAVALAGKKGDVARAPVRMEFGGASFVVKAGGGLLPDWKPSQDEGAATWIDGTVANHIIYLQYSPQMEALFKAVKPGDVVKLTMNTGQVFSFAVTRSTRAVNGPSTTEGQFTVSTAMAQDHVGLTIFLIGDPAADRAVVQADFTGNIQ